MSEEIDGRREISPWSGRCRQHLGHSSWPVRPAGAWEQAGLGRVVAEAGAVEGRVPVGSKTCTHGSSKLWWHATSSVLGDTTS